MLTSGAPIVLSAEAKAGGECSMCAAKFTKRNHRPALCKKCWGKCGKPGHKIYMRTSFRTVDRELGIR